VIPMLARTLQAYRTSMYSPHAGVVFHDGSGRSRCPIRDVQRLACTYC
jgi:hypothetical protein